MSEVFVSINMAGSWHYDEQFDADIVALKRDAVEATIREQLADTLGFDEEEWCTVDVIVEL